jgi:hypothetical protein
VLLGTCSASQIDDQDENELKVKKKVLVLRLCKLSVEVRFIGSM